MDVQFSKVTSNWQSPDRKCATLAISLILERAELILSKNSLPWCMYVILNSIESNQKKSYTKVIR